MNAPGASGTPQPAGPFPVDSVAVLVRKRHRLASRMVRLALSSNGDAGAALALLDDVELPAPFGTHVRAAVAVHADGHPLTFDAVSERLAKSGLLDGAAAFAEIEGVRRGDEEAPGPDTLTECVEAFRIVNAQIEDLDAAAERVRAAGLRVESPEVDGPARPRPAATAGDQIDTPVETWPADVSADAYYGVFGALVAAVSEHTEADPIAILAQSLVGFGNMVGGGPYFNVEATRHHVNENLVLVGGTAVGRKGTAWDQARRPLAVADEGWAHDRIQGGLASGEALIHAVRDPREERQPVNKGGKVVDYQMVVIDEGVSDKRLLIIETELSRVLKVMAREGATLSTIIRQAWDGGSLRVMAKTCGETATAPHVSLIAHITAEELTRQIEETDAASGWGNRFLWCSVKRSRFLPDGADVSGVDFEPIRRDLSNAVDAARKVGEMKRDDQARALWHAEYARLSTGRPGLLGAMLSRAEAHVLRLSMLYALADSSGIIKRPHLQAAIALWDYMARSAAFIFGTRLGDPTADELHRAITAAPDGLTRSEMREHFGRNKSSAEIGRALAVLARANMATPTIEKPDGKGRPTERWRATRPGET